MQWVRMDLSRLQEGESATVLELGETCQLRRRLQELGMIPGTCVHCLRIAPSGSPAVYIIRGAMVALRRSDAAGVAVEAVKWD